MGSKWAVILFTLAARGTVMTNSKDAAAPHRPSHRAHHDGALCGACLTLRRTSALVGGVGRSRAVPACAGYKARVGCPVLAWPDFAIPYGRFSAIGLGWLLVTRCKKEDCELGNRQCSMFIAR